jgi:hypothetical protein
MACSRMGIMGSKSFGYTTVVMRVKDVSWPTVSTALNGMAYILSQTQRSSSGKLLFPLRGHQDPLLSRRGNTYCGILDVFQELTDNEEMGGRGRPGGVCVRVWEKQRRSITRSKPTMEDCGHPHLAIRTRLLNHILLDPSVTAKWGPPRNPASAQS